MHFYSQLEVSTLGNIAKPKKSQLSMLRDWLQDSKGGDCFQKGSEVRLWEDDDTSAFLSLKSPSGETDIFTGWITRMTVGLFHRLWGEKHALGKVVDEESGLVSYDDSNVNTASTIFATILSSILPVVTILVLWTVKSTVKRICITLAFTAIFAAVLAICSSARRVEIFAATATYAIIFCLI
jgi:VIT1/CCC1 family predicted Fe2+/Mn2+ transporter